MPAKMQALVFTAPGKTINYMQISFHGAARTVTGSKHLITLDNGNTILLDCGMFQGMGLESDKLNSEWGFEPGNIQCLILSHAHIDHSGLIPKLVKDGFAGKILATAPTIDLVEILLKDSANIQSNGHGKREETDDDVFYTIDDVAATMALFEAVEYNAPTIITEGFELLFTDTGHLLGSAAIHLAITENDTTTRISFSGDIGRFRNSILCPPEPFPPADYLVMESTYGNNLHEPVFSTFDCLLKVIKQTCVHQKGQLVIPAFSIGRTQELLYHLNQLSLEKKLFNLPVIVDSPLGFAATQIYKKYKPLFNDTLQKIMAVDDDPFDFPELKCTQSVADSKEAAHYEEPCIIIAASGMADAGRIRHHIAATVDNPANTILLAGYCTPSSLGGQLQNGARTVSINGKDYRVNAGIETMHSMSAHGDANDLLRFLDCQDAGKIHAIFLVHGEYESQVFLREKLMAKGFEKVVIPTLHESVELVLQEA